MITIPSGIEDPSYRYKMPKMQLKQESRLNGVKTNIWNVEDVASALRVPASAIMKWMCHELGANMEQTSIIKGDHSYKVMLTHLDKFIKKYVCCKNCGYPELKRYVDGKELKSSCNSCGATGSHDGLHKAGKEIIKMIKQDKTVISDIQAKDGQAQEPEEPVQIKKSKKDKEEEISDLDEDLCYSSRRIDKIIAVFNGLSKDELKDNEVIQSVLDENKMTYGLNYEFQHYVCLSGLFTTKRNIVKNWKYNQQIFVDLVKAEGKVGVEHFMQAVVIYFIRNKNNKDLQKFAQTFMKKLIDESILSEKFLLQWYEKEIRLDQESKIYDKKAEKKFRDLIEEFVEWLKKTEAESSGSEDEEEEKKEEPAKADAAEEEKTDDKDDEEKVEKSEAQIRAEKKQKEMIEKQRKAQAAALEDKKKKQEEEKAKEDAALDMANNREARIDLNAKSEEVDIDDI